MSQDNVFRTEFKSKRYDRFSGAEVEVPEWLPEAVVGMARKSDGTFSAYVDVSWDGGGWIITGSGETELLAANDLIRRLKALK